MNLPKGAWVELVVAKNIEARLFENVEGIVKVKEPLLRLKPMGAAYDKELAAALPDSRYRLLGDRAVLYQIVSPKNRNIPAKVIVHVPDEVKLIGEVLIVLSTLDAEGQAVGGLTLRVNKGSHFQKGGPYEIQARR